MSIGHHPQAAAYSPDMRKEDADITEDQRAEAKRRIEGSLAPSRAATLGLGGGPQAASMAG